MTEVQGLEQESKLSDELDQCLNGICPRMAVTRKHREGEIQHLTAERICAREPPPDREAVGNSQQAEMATNQDTFVSAQKSSKLHFTKCLFLRWHIQGYSSSQNCQIKKLQAQGKEQRCQSRKWSSRYNLHVMVLGMTGQDSA